jgi:hypothetical protein
MNTSENKLETSNATKPSGFFHHNKQDVSHESDDEVDISMKESKTD